jgi:hypothetical protein
VRPVVVGVMKSLLITAAAVMLIPPVAAQAKVNGACGPANGVPVISAPTTGLCSSGSPSRVSGSGPWYWTCFGSGNGRVKSQNCWAPVASSPPPPPVATLTITVAPQLPSVPETAPLGTFVATVTAAWSDGSPFTGTLSFDSPYYDDGGTFALSGNRVIVSPLGKGLMGDGGTVQHVTITAMQ